MGKICAESGLFLEEGLLCLDDYLNINLINPPDEESKGERMKVLALYYVGIIFYKTHDDEQCEKYLSLI